MYNHTEIFHLSIMQICHISVTRIKLFSQPDSSSCSLLLIFERHFSLQFITNASTSCTVKNQPESLKTNFSSKENGPYHLFWGHNLFLMCILNSKTCFVFVCVSVQLFFFHISNDVTGFQLKFNFQVLGIISLA